MKKIFTIAGAATLGLTFMLETQAAGESCKMYFKVDGGYTITHDLKYNNKIGIDNDGALGRYATAMERAKSNSAKDDSKNVKELRGTTFGIGLGYNLSEIVRSDIYISYTKMQNKPEKEKNSRVKYSQRYQC